MIAETRTVTSTSRTSATTEDITIRETTTSRLVFRPMLVVNDRQPDAAVKGTFVYQRKGATQSWEDVPLPPLSSLKKDEAVKLELKSEELLRLFNNLSTLYELFRTQGISRGESKFIKANATIQALAGMSDDELTAVIAGHQMIGAEALLRLIQWATKADNFSVLFDRLQQLGSHGLINLNSALGVAILKRALKDWHDNRLNADESFWQNTLENQTFVLEQLFQVPVVIVKAKAYVGGKSILNEGGHVADFLVQNKITSAAALVEIKTPATPLLGKQYRNGVYNTSSDLTGSVMQVLSYRDSLAQERTNLLKSGSIDTEAFHPMCVVIIGHVRRELSDTLKKKAFELYRQQLRDVQIITYDEMYERTRRLVRVLEQGLR